MSAVTIIVRAAWDADAHVWVAQSPDLPGLILEAPSQDALLEKLQHAIPDLIAETEIETQGLLEIPVVLMSEALTRVRVNT